MEVLDLPTPTPPRKTRSYMSGGAADRRLDVAKRLRKGESVPHIAKAVGVSTRTIGADRRRILMELTAETRRIGSQWLGLEMARMDNLMLKLEKMLDSGSVRAAEAMVKVIQLRMKMLGLEMRETDGMRPGELAMGERPIEVPKDGPLSITELVAVRDGETTVYKPADATKGRRKI